MQIVPTPYINPDPSSFRPTICQPLAIVTPTPLNKEQRPMRMGFS